MDDKITNQIKTLKWLKVIDTMYDDVWHTFWVALFSLAHNT